MTGVALVTGAARGIGKAVARRFAADGWFVYLLDVDDVAGRRVAGDLGAENATFHRVDITRETELAHVIAEVRGGHGRLDVLVNNAATAAHAPVTDLALEDWNRVLATNLTAPFLCVKHAADLLRAAGGSVINIASTRALQSEPDTEAYSASKGGLVALTHALAASLGPDVRVNCISPGWIDVSADHPGGEETLTEADHAQHFAGRVGRPEDVANLAAWLAGPEAGFVTGANFVVDGGMTRKMVYAE